nr:DNA-binding protein [Sulfurimonas sp. SAG-AH-194-I05]
MANMTILEAAEHFGISKEAIHNRVRRGSLVVELIDGVKMVDIDAKVTPKPKTTSTRKAAPSSNEKYHKFLEEQNAKLQSRVDTLEGETRSLRDQKELMLIQEREKIECIYKEKDEQLKNILTTISSQFMLNAPIEVQKEEHVEAEFEVEEIKDIAIKVAKKPKKRCFNFS